MGLYKGQENCTYNCDNSVYIRQTCLCLLITLLVSMMNANSPTQMDQSINHEFLVA